ncbi:MAG: hypothetical protein HY907_00955 [Deltaproteobacteria bacterium]|nr:hypothetical protein [Deltaproteobacteria bacterium]
MNSTSNGGRAAASCLLLGAAIVAVLAAACDTTRGHGPPASGAGGPGQDATQAPRPVAVTPPGGSGTTDAEAADTSPPLTDAAAPPPDAAAPPDVSPPPGPPASDAAAPPPDAAPVAAAAAPSVPTLTLAGAPACTATEPVTLGSSLARRADVAVAFASPDRGLALWALDAERIGARALAVSPGPQVEFALPDANRVEVLAPVGDGFLLLATGPLCDQFGHTCFRTCLLRADGSPAGEPVTEIVDDQNGFVERWLPMTDGIIAALGSRWGPTRVVRYRAAGEGGVGAEVLGEAPHTSGGLGTDALAADGEQVYVLEWSEAHPEVSGRSILRMPGAPGSRFHDLPGELKVLDFSVTPDGLLLFYAAGGGRARLARFSRHGVLDGPPAVSPSGEELPEAVRQDVRFELEMSDGRLMLHRSNVAADGVGEPFEVAKPGRADAASAATWTGRDFAVVWAVRTGREWPVFLRHVRCDGAEP